MFFMAEAAYPTQRQCSKRQFLTMQLTGMRKAVSERDDPEADSALSSSTETRRNAAPSGIHISRYCQDVSAEMNFFAASYQATVICQERVTRPW